MVNSQLHHFISPFTPLSQNTAMSVTPQIKLSGVVGTVGSKLSSVVENGEPTSKFDIGSQIKPVVETDIAGSLLKALI